MEMLFSDLKLFVLLVMVRVERIQASCRGEFRDQ
jgi:hypothetical protein